MGLHLIALHQHGSNNPLGIEATKADKIPFHPYYTAKDFFGLGILGLVWSYFIFFDPNFFGEPDNYIPANPLVTPAHIVPEWYFLPFYAILRSIPNKLFGVIAMFGAVGILFFLPWLDRSPVRSARFRPIFKWVFWTFIIDCFILGIVGAHTPDHIYVKLGGLSNQLLGQLTTAYYFAFFFALVPLLGRFEKPRALPTSFCILLALSGPLYATEASTPPSENWSFQGSTGTFDRTDLQHGFQVFQNVCSTCHSLHQLRFRDLAGLGYSPEEIKAIAADHKIPTLNDEGEPTERLALPTDSIPGPYKNEKAARAANNGAFPPDLSLITKARMGGADYVYALLTGYEQTPPREVQLSLGMSYNPIFPGGQIAMLPPLSEGLVTYDDGSKPSVENMAKDVVTFLAWAAEPEMEARKRMGIRVLIYFLVFTALMYFVMKVVWARVR